MLHKNQKSSSRKKLRPGTVSHTLSSEYFFFAKLYTLVWSSRVTGVSFLIFMKMIRGGAGLNFPGGVFTVCERFPLLGLEAKRGLTPNGAT
jgi:hypothetical protein